MAELTTGLEPISVASEPSTIDNLVRLAPFVEHVVPLLQTFMWVIAVLLAAYMFRQVIQTGTTAVIKRIESGGGIRAGGFELPEFRPQDTQTQKDKLEEELADAPVKPEDAGREPKGEQPEMDSVSHTLVESAPEQESASANAEQKRPDQGAIFSKEKLHTHYFGTASEHEPRKENSSSFLMLGAQRYIGSHLLAEDLALRALQAEYNVNFMRNVSGGPGLEFDAVFTFDETIYVVDVKYLQTAIDARQVKRFVDASFRLRAEKAKNKWRKVRMLLVFVIDDGVPLDSVDEKLSTLLSRSAIDITTRVFSLAELRHRFGVSKDWQF